MCQQRCGGKVLRYFGLCVFISVYAHALPTVAVVTTGGTIASKLDPVTHSVIPAVSGADLIQAVPGLGDLAKIVVHEFSRIDSSRMTPENWRDVSLLVDSLLEEEEVVGVVVTHGTDTMAEGAYFLELTLQSTKPVVFVGSMRDASSLSPDGPENIYNAVLQIVSPEAKNFGVTVTLNQYINAARDVRKTETTNVQSFDSGEKGYLGYIAMGLVHKFHEKPAVRKVALVDAKAPFAKVVILKSFEGDDGSFVRYAVDQHVAGIVIEGVGAGNVNEAVYEAIKYALERGVAVVITTRVPHGAVYPIYGGNGGGCELLDLGALFAGDLPSTKARLLLMLALSQASDPRELATYFV